MQNRPIACPFTVFTWDVDTGIIQLPEVQLCALLLMGPLPTHLSLTDLGVMNVLKRILRNVLRLSGYDVVRFSQPQLVHNARADFTDEERAILKRSLPFTMTGHERIVCLTRAVSYLVTNKIEGDFVECGVWRGGSMMAAMLALTNLGDTSRIFYLYDTYQGMTPPSENDFTFSGESATSMLNSQERKPAWNTWAWATKEEVAANLLSTGYPTDRIRLIEGDVLKTIPSVASDKIALLRLDSDWSESTKHELTHLYPRLVKHGVLIIDDYGHWQGSRRAVDAYFQAEAYRPFLHRMDYTGRCLVKC